MLEVEGAVRVAGPGAEPHRLRVGERAVVVEAGLAPVAPRHRVRPLEEVLPAAPALLDDALGVRDRAQPGELLGGAPRVAVGPEAGVQADLVAAPVDVADEPADPRMLDDVVGALARVDPGAGEEVERAAQPVALADVHHEVEGVVGVEAPVAAPRGDERARPAHGQQGVLAQRQVARELARDQRGPAAEPRQRVVDVVGERDLEGARTAPQPRPHRRQGAPQQLHVGVDERDLEEALAGGDRRRGREAVVRAPVGHDQLLVAGEHEERAAEHVDAQPHLTTAHLPGLEQPLPRAGAFAVEHRQALARRRRDGHALGQRRGGKRRRGEPVALGRREQHVGDGHRGAWRLAVEAQAHLAPRPRLEAVVEAEPVREHDVEHVAALGLVAGRRLDDERRHPLPRSASIIRAAS